MPRDGSGNYTLPSGNPVVGDTIIATSWANPTMSDFAVQLNNVLTRDGLLGPTQPIGFVSGTIGNPGIKFAGSPLAGLYNPAVNVVGIVAGGQEVARASLSGLAVNVGQLFVPPGSIASPGVVFNSATGMGMSAPDTTTIAWSISNGERMRLANTIFSLGGSAGVPTAISMFGNGAASIALGRQAPYNGYGQAIELGTSTAGEAAFVYQSVAANDERVILLNNAIPPSGAYTGTYQYVKTSTNASATAYLQNAGQHIWYTAPIGAGGAAITFTEVLRFNAAGAIGLAGTNYGTAGQVLTSNGAAAPPVWAAAGGGAPVAFPPGSAGAPGAYFTGDATTGAWSPSAGILAWSTSGTEKLRIANNGNVGIGTTVTPTKLNVAGNVIFAGTAPFVALAVDFAGSTPAYFKYDTTTSIADIAVNGTGGGNGTLRFLTGIASASERVRINETGAIGLNGANYGTSGQVLTSGGSAATPTWTTSITAASGAAGAAGSHVTLTSGNSGTGAPGNILLKPGSTGGGLQDGGVIYLGAGVAVSTTATQGYVFYPQCAGKPSIAFSVGQYTNMGAAIFDTTNSRMWWKSANAIPWRPVSFQGIGQIKSADTGFVLEDSDPHVITIHPSSDANARTFTIPANASVAFPIGSQLHFINDSVNAISIAITTDTLVLAGPGTTGTRTLAQYGRAIARKVDTTRWYIWGTNLT